VRYAPDIRADAIEAKAKEIEAKWTKYPVKVKVKA
jgi:hypothetical protein